MDKNRLWLTAKCLALGWRKAFLPSLSLFLPLPALQRARAWGMVTPVSGAWAGSPVPGSPCTGIRPWPPALWGSEEKKLIIATHGMVIINHVVVYQHKIKWMLKELMYNADTMWHIASYFKCLPRAWVWSLAMSAIPYSWAVHIHWQILIWNGQKMIIIQCKLFYNYFLISHLN